MRPRWGIGRLVGWLAGIIVVEGARLCALADGQPMAHDGGAWQRPPRSCAPPMACARRRSCTPPMPRTAEKSSRYARMGQFGVRYADIVDKSVHIVSFRRRFSTLSESGRVSVSHAS